MVQRSLLIGAVVLALLAPTAAVAGERAGTNGGDGESGRQEAVAEQRREGTDQVTTVTAERDRDRDRIADRDRDRDADGDGDHAVERERERIRDDAPVCDRATDRVTDCRIEDDQQIDRPEWAQILERCLWHHVGDRPIWEGMAPREIRHLLQRCLWHHHEGLPV